MKYAGKSGSIKLSNDDAPDVIGECRGFSVNTTAATADSTVLGDTWQTHALVSKGWEATIECLFDHADAAQAVMVEGTAVQVELYPEGSARHCLFGSGTVTACSAPVARDDLVSYSVTVTGTAELYRAPQTITVAGAGTTAANGSYVFSEVSSGTVAYVKGIYIAQGNAQQTWSIEDNNQTSLYTAAAAVLPPKTGWAADAGTAPAPTIYYPGDALPT